MAFDMNLVCQKFKNYKEKDCEINDENCWNTNFWHNIMKRLSLQQKYIKM